MADPVFFAAPQAARLSDVAAWCGARLTDLSAGDRLIRGIAPLSEAQDGDLSFLDNPKYIADATATRASACLVSPRLAGRIPAHVAVLESAEPYRAFATIGARLYPQAVRLQGPYGEAVIDAAALVHPTARLEAGVVVEPGAVIGARAEIGSGTVISANAVIGHDVRFGRDGYVGPNASIMHALIGNRVIVHAGVRIGQDGFGFAMGPRGHLKVPQIGRVVIQDDVEIGANTTIDRGATRDTIIGEGTKIDNQVQIGHNVVIGRHCVLVGHVGISGSVTLEDFVVMGGKAATVGHIRIGMGAQIAGSSNVKDDVPPGARWGGTPAKPVKAWFREMTALKRLGEREGRGDKDGKAGGDAET